MKKIILFIACLFLIISGCEKKQKEEAKKVDYEDKKILIVHSYHPEIKGVIEKNKGLISVLKNVGVEYKIIYMDTKRNTGEDFKKKSALMAKDTIEDYRPDVIITFDDNAFKYLIMPYFKDSELPVVFAGIDWDASMYGAPYSNTTGMVSVALVPQMIDYTKKHARGERIGWLGYDTFTARKETKAYQDILGITMSIHYVTNFKEWQNTFLKLQTETDIIIHSGMLTGMKDWDEYEAAKFALNNIKVPIGAVDKVIMCCSVFGLVKIPSEKGEWTAKTALEIIGGKAPSDIPLTRNKKGEIILNLDLAEKLDIAFDVKILKNAQIYQEDK
jgi:ABC-type uncharacterized transport system substrate-binding protein